MGSLPEHTARAERAREGWKVGSDGRLYRKVPLTELDFEKLWDRAEELEGLRPERPAIRMPWRERLSGWFRRVLSRKNRTLGV